MLESKTLKSRFKSFLIISSVVISTTLSNAYAGTNDALSEKDIKLAKIDYSHLLKIKPVVSASPSKKKQTKATKASKEVFPSNCMKWNVGHINRKSVPFNAIIAEYSKQYRIDSNLVKSIITAESCFRVKALSHAGAQGLMQLIPATADRFGVKNSYDPKQNIRGGVKYLRFLHDYFNGDLKKMIAGYNAGEGAVTRYKGIPPYKETIQYVKNVLLTYDKLRAPSLASAKLAKKRLAQAKRDRLAKASLADKIRKQTARPTNKTKKVRHVYQPPRLGLKPGRGGWQYNRARARHLYKK